MPYLHYCKIVRQCGAALHMYVVCVLSAVGDVAGWRAARVCGSQREALVALKREQSGRLREAPAELKMTAAICGRRGDHLSLSLFFLACGFERMPIIVYKYRITVEIHSLSPGELLCSHLRLAVISIQIP
jgi:hypothetical protein